MMRYRGPAVLVAIFVFMVLFSTAPVGSGSPTKAPPFKDRTEWNHRHVAVSAAGETQTGTIKEFYGGQMTYRGRTYHFFVQSYTLIAVVERDYLEWAGTHFRLVASEVIDSQKNWLEVIFDRAIDIGVQTNVSGTAVIFQNGIQKATAPWSYSASSRGTVKVTVPAGTFQTTEWETVLRLGPAETFARIYAVGIQGVRTDTKIYASGSLTTTWYTELVSGPVR